MDLDTLKDLNALKADIEAIMADTVVQLRSSFGYSWADIGEAMGMRRESAWERFGKRRACQCSDPDYCRRVSHT